MKQSESKKIVLFIVLTILTFGQNLSADGLETGNRFEKLVKKGNRLFDDGALQEALQHYDEALDLLEIAKPPVAHEWEKTLITRIAYTELLLGHEERFLEIFSKHLGLILSQEELLAVASGIKKPHSLHRKIQNYLQQNPPRNDMGYFVQAWLAFDMGHWNRAIPLFESLVQKARKNSLRQLGMLYLSFAYLANGEHHQALQNIENAIHQSNKAPLANTALLIAAQIYEHLDNDLNACNAYEKITDISEDALERLILCRLRLFEKEKSILEKTEHLHAAQNLLDGLWAKRRYPMALSHYYIFMQNQFADPIFNQAAKQVLELKNWDNIDDAEAHFLLAEIALNDQEALSHYETIITEAPSSYWAILARLGQGNLSAKQDSLAEAQHYFKEIFQNPLAPEKFAKIALLNYLETGAKDPGLKKGVFQLCQSLYNHPDAYPAIPKDFRIYAAFHTSMTESYLEELKLNHPNSPWTPAAIYEMACLQFENGDDEQAERNFKSIVDQYPQSLEAGEAAYFFAETAKRLNRPKELIQRALRTVFDFYPYSQHAANSYLDYYDLADYVSGNSDAIQHLTLMPNRFPFATESLYAYYLLGLHYKRDKYSDSGKLLENRDLIAAIDAFQNGETLYENLESRGLIPADARALAEAIRKDCLLERAQANMTIANESEGYKRIVYLEYCADVYQQMVNTCKMSADPLLDESLYLLGEAKLKLGQSEAAKEIFTEILTTGKENYHLSRAHYQLAKIAKNEARLEDALKRLEQASETGIHTLNMHQKLDLLIEEALCYQGLGEKETAMRILSRVINEDVASQQRLRAMYLRAEIYLEEGRNELAIKQWEALQKKGGPWAQKAKEKLENLWH